MICGVAGVAWYENQTANASRKRRDRIVEACRELAAGNRAVRVPAWDLAEQTPLGIAFNDTANALEESFDRIARLTDSLVELRRPANQVNADHALCACWKMRRLSGRAKIPRQKRCESHPANPSADALKELAPAELDPCRFRL